MALACSLLDDTCHLHCALVSPSGGLSDRPFVHCRSGGGVESHCCCTHLPGYMATFLWEIGCFKEEKKAISCRDLSPAPTKKN